MLIPSLPSLPLPLTSLGSVVTVNNYDYCGLTDNPCMNGGSCVNALTSYLCVCALGLSESVMAVVKQKETFNALLAGGCMRLSVGVVGGAMWYFRWS